MSHALDSLNHLIQTHPALRVFSALRTAFPAAKTYLVGGAVRDALLGRPIGDLDTVVTGVSREELEPWLTAHGRVDLVGRVFGVYKFTPLAQPLTLDIALPRSERSTAESAGGFRDFDTQIDAHLPIEQDLARRDFTMNAMAVDLGTGELLDPYGGQQDLHARLIRTVGSPTTRFAEDLSRVLRALRFACQLNIEIDATTWDGLCTHVPHLNRQRARADGRTEYVLPRETIGREWHKAFTASPDRAALLFWKSGALALLLPEVVAGMGQDPSSFFASLRSAPTLSIAYALFLRHVPSDGVKRALTRIGLPSIPLTPTPTISAEDIARLVHLLQHPPTPASIESLPAREIEMQFMSPDHQDAIPTLIAGEYVRIVDAIQKRVTTIRQVCRVPTGPIPPLLSGTDLLDMGVPEGPNIGYWLAQVREEQLQGHLYSTQDARQWLQQKTAQ